MNREQAPWLWLCVLPQLPPEEEIRAFWKGELDEISDRAADEDQFWLGVSGVSGVSGRVADRPSASAADRVASLLFRHGTTPRYTLPKLTRPMVKSIRAAFAPAGADSAPTASQDRLWRFLRAHRGDFALVRDGGGPNIGDHDEEMDRLILEHAASQPFGVRVTRKTVRRSGDESPDDDDEGGVREPRRPLPDSPPTSAALEPDREHY